jgi:hypothetical protein
VTGADATGVEVLAIGGSGAVVFVVGPGIDAAPIAPSAWTLPSTRAPFGRVVGAVVTVAEGGWVVEVGFVCEGAGLCVVGAVVAGAGRVVVGVAVVGATVVWAAAVGRVGGAMMVWSGDPVGRAAAEGADAGLVAGGATDRGGALFASANAALPNATSTMSPTADITEARAMRTCRMVLPAMVLLDVVRALRSYRRIAMPWARSIPPRSPLSAIIRLLSVKRVTFQHGTGKKWWTAGRVLTVLDPGC